MLIFPTEDPNWNWNPPCSSHIPRRVLRRYLKATTRQCSTIFHDDVFGAYSLWLTRRTYRTCYERHGKWSECWWLRTSAWSLLWCSLTEPSTADLCTTCWIFVLCWVEGLLFHVNGHTYTSVGNAFGRVPIVIHLGDFLQLRPTAQLSLSGERKYHDVPLEAQHAQALLSAIAESMESQGSVYPTHEQFRRLFRIGKHPCC